MQSLAVGQARDHAFRVPPICGTRCGWTKLAHFQPPRAVPDHAFDQRELRVGGDDVRLVLQAVPRGPTSTSSIFSRSMVNRLVWNLVRGVTYPNLYTIAINDAAGWRLPDGAARALPYAASGLAIRSRRTNRLGKKYGMRGAGGCPSPRGPIRDRRAAKAATNSSWSRADWRRSSSE